MQVNCKWESGMKFDSEASGFSVVMDAKRPIGRGQGMSPKELVVAGLCGCTGMDVVGWLRKSGADLKSLSIHANVTMRVDGHPMIFDHIRLRYELEGDISYAMAEKAVLLSQTQYCAISAMLSQTAEITYSIYINGTFVNEGRADFNHLHGDYEWAGASVL